MRLSMRDQTKVHERGARSRRARAGAAALLVAALWGGCDPGRARPSDAALDADAEDWPGADRDEQGEAEADADLDSGPTWTPGPLTFVVHDVEFLDQRVCDVDGDGDLDNAFADLGSQASSLAVRAFTAALAGSPGSALRPVIHAPSLDEPPAATDRELSVVAFLGRDVDQPADPSDDLSGEEPFYAAGSTLDACGEPRAVWRGARLRAGRLTAETAFLMLGYNGIPLRLHGSFDGTLAADGSAVEATMCGFWAVAELGFDIHAGMTGLELLSAGGAAYGIPDVPGLEPDLDLDGDGLERFVLDADNHIDRCIDGDGFTVIEGRDCWQDARMADGFALTVRIAATTARFAGREPGWQYVVGEWCEAGMPEESALGHVVHDVGCAGPEEPCDPLAARACCDAERICQAYYGASYRCALRCQDTSCDCAGRPGVCTPDPSGTYPDHCEPLGRPLVASECTPSEEGCATEYGVSEGTVCIGLPELNVCRERCALAGPTGCEMPHPLCLPLVFDEGGFCG